MWVRGEVPLLSSVDHMSIPSSGSVSAGPSAGISIALTTVGIQSQAWISPEKSTPWLAAGMRSPERLAKISPVEMLKWQKQHHAWGLAGLSQKRKLVPLVPPSQIEHLDPRSG